MQLTDSEIRLFKNVLWGTRFWRWFRWVPVAVLAHTAVTHFSGWRHLQRIDWLAAGAVCLLVAWPGPCRTFVFYTLHRLVAEDPEARTQPAAAGVMEFQSGVAVERA